MLDIASVTETIVQRTRLKRDERMVCIMQRKTKSWSALAFRSKVEPEAAGAVGSNERHMLKSFVIIIMYKVRSDVWKEGCSFSLIVMSQLRV